MIIVIKSEERNNQAIELVQSGNGYQVRTHYYGRLENVRHYGTKEKANKYYQAQLKKLI